MNNPATDTFLRDAEVTAITGLSRSSRYELMAENPPRFPRPIRLSRNRVAWSAREISEWQEQLRALRDGKAA
ncbi:MAG TPA: AlpA family phage regulatory protein [Hyphomicrobiaceae bacterium]|jgi:prophage regulatory protein